MDSKVVRMIDNSSDRIQIGAKFSIEHCDHAGTGCPVAALAPEVARTNSSVRKRTVSLMKERLSERCAA
jgi:hypothetical protein